MSQPIETYAMIGDRHSAALVGLDGSIDWLCLPRFDGPAAFAALLGTPQNGRWRIAPSDHADVSRVYEPYSLVLRTTFTTAAGSVTLTDAMLLDRDRPCVLREVTGVSGVVEMCMEYIVRFDYGSIVPWVQRVDGGLVAVAGSDGLYLASDVPLESKDFATTARFTVRPGERLRFDLTHYPSYETHPAARVPDDAIETIVAGWREWTRDFAYEGPHADLVCRSLVTLHALAYAPTGGIVAAPTASLPEKLGGVRNWDYRYCWLRDATFTLDALLLAGHEDTAVAWRNWLIRAVAGAPSDLQIVYDIRGNRRLPEMELAWLDGYAGSKPVRIGNGAHGQFQLDVFGEVIDLLSTAHEHGITSSDSDWRLFTAIVGEAEKRWKQPDRGIWEIRGNPQHFTHSKVMAWVALDRAVRAVERFGLEGPVDRWRATRDEIHADVCARGWSEEHGSFMQAYDSHLYDASTLLMPLVGFLPVGDPRVRGTIAAIEQHLLRDGVVYRYSQDKSQSVDGLPAGEGAFLACSFWLVDTYVLADRIDEAEAFFERLVALCNDVGLLSEEYDPQAKRLVGNFPQAFSHVGLITSAFNLWHHTKPVHRRSGKKPSAAGRKAFYH